MINTEATDTGLPSPCTTIGSEVIVCVKRRCFPNLETQPKVESADSCHSAVSELVVAAISEICGNNDSTEHGPDMISV